MVFPAFILQQEFMVPVVLLIFLIELLLAAVLIRTYFRIRRVRTSPGTDFQPDLNAKSASPVERPVMNESGQVPDLDRNLELSENMHRILGKYQLQRFTISTEDGLVVVSSDEGSEPEAAAMSHLYRSWGGSDLYTLTIFGVPHKGTPLVGIVKRYGALSDSDLIGIESDAGRVISWFT